MADLPKPLPASEWQHDMWTADQLEAYAAIRGTEAHNVLLNGGL